MVVANLVFYVEKNKFLKVRDRHPLKYRFNKAVNKVSIENLGNNINLSVRNHRVIYTMG